MGKFPNFAFAEGFALAGVEELRHRRAMTAPQTPPPFDPAATWPQETLSYAVGELSREFSTLPIGRIVAAVTGASRAVSADNGRVRLLQKARDLLGEA